MNSIFLPQALILSGVLIGGMANQVDG